MLCLTGKKCGSIFELRSPPCKCGEQSLLRVMSLNTTKLKEVVFHSAYSCVFVCARLCALLTEWVCLFSTTVIITALITQGNCG